MQTPLVSIIIPLFNRDTLVGQTLDSVLAQTDARWEAIVIDDHSTDTSLAVAQSYADKDERFIVAPRSGVTRGASACRNEGFARARAQWLMFLDCDDLITPDCLAQRLATLAAHPALEMGIWPARLFTYVPGDSVFLWNKQNAGDAIDRFLDNDPPWQTTGGLIRTSAVQRIGGWDERALNWQDWEFYLRLLISGVSWQGFDDEQTEPDLLWRQTDPARASISSRSRTPAHFLGRRVLINRISQELLSANMLTQRRRDLLVRQRFEVAAALAELNDVQSANDTWRDALQHNDASADTHRAGQRVLDAWATPTKRKKLHNALKQSHPSLDVFRRSPTHMRYARPPANWSPPVSVVIPAFNAERYIVSAVQSVLKQTFGEFELVIVDDGSTDRTAQILDDIARSDQRVRVIHQANTGIVGALNNGVAASRAPLIARMDADDLCTPDRLAKQVAFMNANPDVVLLGGAWDYIDADSRRLRTMRSPTDDAELQAICLTARCPICHPLSMYRRAAFNTVGGYDSAYLHAEDIDLWLRLGEVGKMACLPDVLLKYRLHAASISESKQVIQLEIQKRAALAAHVRRGLAPGDINSVAWRSTGDAASEFSQIIKYGWWAWSSRERRTALAYGFKAVRSRPLSPRGWKLMFSSVMRNPKSGGAK